MGVAEQLWIEDSQPVPVSRELALPLVLDLDGTIARTDLLVESAALFVRQNILHIWLLVGWLLSGGVCRLKERLASRVTPAAALLPLNEALIDYARGEHLLGRNVIIATASHQTLADAVARRLGFVSEAIGSIGTVNLKGRHKADTVAKRFPQGYSYAGDCGADLAVWKGSASAIYVGNNSQLKRKIERLTHLEAAFERPRVGWRVWARAIRIHQWTKNILVLLPLFLAGHALNVRGVESALIGFLATSLVASATYLLNDIIDIEDDRRHWHKRHRPIAAGVLPIHHAIMAAAAMLLVAFPIVAWVGGFHAMGLLTAYLAATTAYSFKLKRLALIDVVTLAGLFTLRLAIGAAMTHVVLSSWLAVFSMFLFGSLALAKRATELGRHKEIQPDRGSHIAGRGYVLADLATVTAFGTASAIGATIIMVMYLVQEAFPANVYAHPQMLWAVPPVIALWLGRIWLLCGRGTLNDDPVAFAIRDRASLGFGSVMLAAFLLAELPSWI